MRPMLLIAAREWRAFVFSPTGLVVTLLYLVVAGYLFALHVTLSQEASLRATFSALGLLTIFMVPLITMRLLSEELRTGTFEVLIAHPVTDAEVVLGKYLAGWWIFLGLTLPGLGYLLILQAFGSPDWGMALSGYLGQQLLGLLLLALGLFISATTNSQVLAAMGAMIGGILLWLAGTAALSVGGWLGDTLAYLAIFEHYGTFRRGVIDSRSLFFFLGTTVMLLYLGMRAVESRRWKFGVMPGTAPPPWRYARWSMVLAGLGLLIVGEACVSRFTRGLWSVYQTLLVVAGCASIALPFWWNRVRLRAELARRRVGPAGTVTVNSLLVLAIWALAIFITSSHYFRLDWTRTQHHALSEQTRSILQRLDVPVEVTVVMSQPADLRQAIQDLLAEYGARSPLFTVQHLDPLRRPAEVEALRQRHNFTTPPANELVLATANQVRRIPVAALVNRAVTVRDGRVLQGPAQFVGEAEIIASLVQLTRASSGRALFLTGHGQRSPSDSSPLGASVAAGELLRAGWTVDAFGVTPGSGGLFPPDTGLVVVAGPRTRLANEDIEALQRFLDRGGGVLVLIDPGIESGLDPLLNAWNVRLGNNLVVDLQDHVAAADPSSLYVTRFKADDPIGKGMGSLAAVLPGARRIAVAYAEANPAVFTSNFMHTSGNSWAVEYDPGQPIQSIQIDRARDRRGPISLGIACERFRERPEPGQPPLRGRLVVIGDSDFVSNQHVDLAGNMNLFLNCVDWLAGRQELISVRPKVSPVARLELTAARARTVFWLSLVVLPGIVLLTGAAVHFHRRRTL